MTYNKHINIGKVTLLGINFENNSKQINLEKIKKYLYSSTLFCHIVSLNPENIVISQHNPEFKKVIETAQIIITDGVGVVVAGQILGITLERVTGVSFMEDLIELADKRRLRVLLIGGQANLALKLSDCYQRLYPEAKFMGIKGFTDIKNPKKNEEQAILSIVRQYKPHLILAAFGSPWQEIWLDRHSNEFKGIVCMGVGQGFDIYGGLVKRAPTRIQKIGLEWLYRLVIQPWRWRRQLRLIQFIWLVFFSLITNRRKG